MSDDPKCPKCDSENTYSDGSVWTCPDCSHEWSAFASPEASADAAAPLTEGVRDAYGNLLASGDTVTVLKDLKVKGANATVKSGTKVKNIRLVDGHDGHNIACRIDGIGAMNLKSEFVKKI